MAAQEFGSTLAQARWMNAVDDALRSRIGLTHDEIDDWPWAAAHEAGERPEDAAERMLAETMRDRGLPE